MNKTRLHKRVKEYIVERKLDYSNPEIQANIKQLGVLVDAKLENNRLHWVEAYEDLDIEHWPRHKQELIDAVEVFYEDKHLLIFNKPYGLVVEAGVGNQHNNLVAYLAKHYPELEVVSEQFGLLHRLDKNTQGLIMVAKSVEAYAEVKRLFKERLIQKGYLGLLQGAVPSGYLECFQARDPYNPKKQRAFATEEQAMAKTNRARYCWTGFNTLLIDEPSNQSLVAIRIKTGRTHQIRVAAEKIGHPLVAEELYNHQQRNPFSLIPTKMSAKIIPQSTFEEQIIELFNGHSFGLLSNSLIFTLFDLQYELEIVNVASITV
jgi:RluA family pseudouridine synthase